VTVKGVRSDCKEWRVIVKNLFKQKELIMSKMHA